MWDPRAKAIIYELATGNNSVVSMVWDEPRLTLFAATECTYMDRLGHLHEYRRAKIPKKKKKDKYHIDGSLKSGVSGMDVDGEEIGDDGDDYVDDDRRWPRDAHHEETYFGIALDAGEHRICE